MFERSKGLSRREFVQAIGVGAAGVAATHVQAASRPGRPRAVIQLCLVGGPSQIDTWDPKPDASEQVRGPFHTIATKTPGIYLSECFPKMARLTDRFSLIRSLHHEASPIHETGQHLMQTGHAFAENQPAPHFGAVVSKLFGDSPEGVPAWMGMPGPIGNTGVPLPQGQDAANLGPECNARWLSDLANRLADGRVLAAAQRLGIEPHYSFDPKQKPLQSEAALRAFDLHAEHESTCQRYGSNRFGQSCLLARRLVEAGVRVVTVNMFETVFGGLSWDMHANGGNLAVTLEHYRNKLCPMFDTAFSALIEDLQERGMFDDVLVVASGEFGRTPKINPRGGRDHWVGAWTALVAGGDTQGGVLVGASDPHGAYPVDRPVTPGELVASVYHSIGVSPYQLQSVLADRELSAPIHELF